ncbi:MAG: hypothetical protein IPF92_24360 [Myxococcales bacterium]|jgi:hypothetical protein|nr:hypothetical protein [Myxococcales bacterium]MBL0193471.1 hypothetical protein [Myxococcales bacterium]HQY64434.1 hypothetical protein [Polyangiaceae bacterium]
MPAPALSSVSLPPWGVALALAAGAPFFARLLSERWVGARRAATEAMLARARAATAPADAAPSPDVAPEPPQSSPSAQGGA